MPVTGDLSPLTSVSFFTRLLNTAEVNQHARLTAVIATCLSVVKSNDIVSHTHVIWSGYGRQVCTKVSHSGRVPSRMYPDTTLVVKRLSSLPSKQGAGVRLPPSVFFPSLSTRPLWSINYEKRIMEGYNVLHGQITIYSATTMQPNRRRPSQQIFRVTCSSLSCLSSLAF